MITPTPSVTDSSGAGTSTGTKTSPNVPSPGALAVEVYDQLYWPNCQTFVDFGCVYTASIFEHSITTTTYLLARHSCSSPSTEELHAKV